jgi:hypothetical protein
VSDNPIVRRTQIQPSRNAPTKCCPVSTANW